MSYQVLARKWRPQNFQQLVGQEHVQRALVNALNDDRLHHAYLFTGTRGVGKTTIARIFSKSLNCEEGISAIPCDKCASCQEIMQGRFVDLIEVDAASRTGVDDTRELLENVQYAPTRARYKVYLIDEVHMFSKSSFNALLKTLEEPPPHVKFLLATTDPQKLPVTILSRCLQFNLKRLPISLISTHLQYILEQENVTSEVMALQLIAHAADGSMRDALSLLDQALAYGGGKVEEQEVRDMLGNVARGKVLDLLAAVLQRDATQTMQQVAQLAELSPDFEHVLAEILSILHHMSIAKTVPEALDEFVGEKAQLVQLSQNISVEDLQLFYQIALTGRRDLPLAPDARSGFEMLLLRMLAFRPAPVDHSNIRHNTAALTVPVSPSSTANTKKASKTVVSASTSTPSEITPVASTPSANANVSVPETTQVPVALANTSDAKIENWGSIVNALGLGGLVQQLALNCILLQREGNKITLSIQNSHSQLLNVKAKQRLQQALGEHFGIDANLDIKIEKQSAQATPAQNTQNEIEQRQLQAEQSIEQDSFTQNLKDSFNAQLIPGSVKPNT